MTATGGRPTRIRATKGGKPVPGLWLRDGRVYEVQVQRDGRAYRRTLAARTVTDAEREARAFVADLDRGLNPASRPEVTLAKLRDDWDLWARQQLAPRTVELYSQKLKLVLKLL